MLVPHSRHGECKLVMSIVGNSSHSSEDSHLDSVGLYRPGRVRVRVRYSSRYSSRIVSM